MQKYSQIILVAAFFLASCQASPPAETPFVIEPVDERSAGIIKAQQVEETQAEIPQPDPIPTPAGTGSGMAEDQSPTFPRVETPFELPPGTETLLLLGSDSAFPIIQRTDTILFLFLNRPNGTAALLSYPADLVVSQPDGQVGKLNEQFKEGGPDRFKNTIEYNHGFSPAKWALIHFDSFIEFVDDQGGVTLEVKNPLPDDCGGVPAGQVHLDGASALCYVREIRTSGEFDRNLRMLSLLKAVIQQTVRFDNLAKLPGWYSKYRNTVQTDLGLFDLLRYFPLALKIKDLDNIRYFQVSPVEVLPVQLPAGGGSGQAIDPQKFRILMENIIQSLDG